MNRQRRKVSVKLKPVTKRLLLVLVLVLFIGGRASAIDHGVILLYHHVSAETPGITSVTPEQFDDHLAYLAENNFQVVPLLQLLDAIYAGKPVPDNAVAITFDDAYLSVYEQAFPRLRERGWPFTIFVAHNPVDRGFKQFISWDQLREMRNAGVDFGGHTSSHIHLIRRQPGESKRNWKARIRSEIDVNIERLEQELDIDVRSFAYPYGEYNDVVMRLIKTRGLYGLAQQSGAVARTVSPRAIPRFPMMQGYDDRDRLKVALNSHALPIEVIDRLPVILTAGERVGPMRFRLPEGPYRTDHLACYGGSAGALEIKASPPRYEVQLPSFAPGRNKVNCTAPSTKKTGEFFWFSRQWVVKHQEGNWPKE